MNFDKKKGYGKQVGYLFSYLIFTTILYFILRFLDKMPSGWGYFHVIMLTIAISIIGFIIKRWLR